MRRQFMQQWWLGGRMHQGMSAQEDGGVRQQSHAPSQPQAVEKQPAQTQLVLLVGLGRLDPRTHLLQQPLRRPSRQGQQTEQGFMIAGTESELARALRSFPAALAKDGFAGHSKPVLILQRLILQPAQRLALRTLRSVPGDVRGHQLHVRSELGHHRDSPAFSAKGLGLARHVTHAGHDDLGPPEPTSLAI